MGLSLGWTPVLPCKHSAVSCELLGAEPHLPLGPFPQPRGPPLGARPGSRPMHLPTWCTCASICSCADPHASVCMRTPTPPRGVPPSKCAHPALGPEVSSGGRAGVALGLQPASRWQPLPSALRG